MADCQAYASHVNLLISFSDHGDIKEPGTYLETRITVHSINGLQTQAGRFVQEEVDENGAEEIAGGEDEPISVMNVSYNEGREEGKQEAKAQQLGSRVGAPGGGEPLTSRASWKQ